MAPLDAIAGRFKYDGAHGLLSVFARLACRAARALEVDPRSIDAVVAVPMDWRRWFLRPYNPSELIAQAVARELDVPLARGLIDAAHGPRQNGLTREERATNAAARYRRGKGRAPRIVVLVDDVWTTGATAAACARALKRGGAKRVYLVTAARKW